MISRDPHPPPHVASWPGAATLARTYEGCHILGSEDLGPVPWSFALVKAPPLGAKITSEWHAYGLDDENTASASGLSDYFSWLEQIEPGEGWERALRNQLALEKGRTRCRSLFRRLRVLSVDALAARHSNGTVNHFCHPWGELMVEVEPELEAPRPFALPLGFLRASFDTPIAATVLGEVENLGQRRDAEPVVAGMLGVIR